MTMTLASFLLSGIGWRVSMKKNTDAKLIHYTLGTPCFNDFRDTDMAEIWYDYYESAKKGFDQ
jgi:hypothetical protein